MKFEKVDKIETFRFYISEKFYCQCEVDLVSKDGMVEVLFSIYGTDTGLSEQLHIKSYSCAEIVNDVERTLETCLYTLLNDERVWNELIPLVFSSRKEYHLFAAEHEAKFLRG